MQKLTLSETTFREKKTPPRLRLTEEHNIQGYIFRQRKSLTAETKTKRKDNSCSERELRLTKIHNAQGYSLLFTEAEKSCSEQVPAPRKRFFRATLFIAETYTNQKTSNRRVVQYRDIIEPKDISEERWSAQKRGPSELEKRWSVLKLKPIKTSQRTVCSTQKEINHSRYDSKGCPQTGDPLKKSSVCRTCFSVHDHTLPPQHHPSPTTHPTPSPTRMSGNNWSLIDMHRSRAPQFALRSKLADWCQTTPQNLLAAFPKIRPGPVSVPRNDRFGVRLRRRDLAALG